MDECYVAIMQWLQAQTISALGIAQASLKAAEREQQRGDEILKQFEFELAKFNKRFLFVQSVQSETSEEDVWDELRV